MIDINFLNLGMVAVIATISALIPSVLVWSLTKNVKVSRILFASIWIIAVASPFMSGVVSPKYRLTDDTAVADRRSPDFKAYVDKGVSDADRMDRMRELDAETDKRTGL